VVEIGNWSHVKFTFDELVSQTVIGKIVVIFRGKQWCLWSPAHAGEFKTKDGSSKGGVKRGRRKYEWRREEARKRWSNGVLDYGTFA